VTVVISQIGILPVRSRRYCVTTLRQPSRSLWDNHLSSWSPCAATRKHREKMSRDSSGGPSGLAQLRALQPTPIKLKEPYVTLPLRRQPCGFNFYKCSFCSFWVGAAFASDLAEHIRKIHMECWRGQKTTLVAKPLSALRNHVTFPQFVGTNVDDEAIFSLSRIAVYYLKSNQFVNIPYIQIAHLVTNVQYYICPFCHHIVTIEADIKSHLPLHLHIRFEYVHTLSVLYCTVQYVHFQNGS
jgi:hypothetical protein